MKVTVIPIVSGALGTISKRLQKVLEDLEVREQVKTRAMLSSVRIMRRVLETEATWCYTNSCEKPFAIAGVENSQRRKIIIIQENDEYKHCCDRYKTINHIISKCRREHKRNFRTSITRGGRWSIENCARNWNFTRLTNGICTNQKPP